MNPDKIPESPGARKLRLFLEAQGYKRGEAKGRAEGEAKGRAEGEAKGEAKGRAEGEAKGAVKGKQDALLALLKARGLSVSTEERAALRACDDPAKLDKWIIRAASAESTGEVLGSRTRTRATRARNGVRKRAAARAS